MHFVGSAAKERVVASVKKYPIWICLFIWALCQISYYLYYGISMGGDSQGFIKGATSFLNGNIRNSGVADYFSYVWILAILEVMTLRPEWVIFIQLFFSIFAVVSLYRTIFYYSKCEMSGFFGVLTFCLFPAVCKWNLYVLTDSLFISSITILLYFLFCTTGRLAKIITIFLALFTLTLRPNGIILVSGLGGFFLYKIVAKKNKKLIIAGMATFLLLTPAILQFVEKKFSGIQVLSIFLKGQIVWGFSEGSLKFPEDGFVPQYSSELMNLLIFAIKNPIFFLKLSFLKLYYFLTLTLPIQAFKYQFITLLAWVPTFFASYRGFTSEKLGYQFKFFSFGMIIAQMFMVTITYNDYDLRFMHHLLPILTIYWSISFSQWKDLKKGDNFLGWLKLSLGSWPVLMSLFFCMEYLTILRAIKNLIFN